MLFCREAVFIPLQDPYYLPELVVFSFRDKVACKGLNGFRCSSGKSPRSRPVACVGSGVGCVTGEAEAGAMVGGAAVVADEGPDVCSNRAVAASAGDSVVVSWVHTEGEGRF